LPDDASDREPRSNARVFDIPTQRPRATDEEIIRVVDLVKRFDEYTVLDGVSFSVKRGETVVIAGPSGSGKSTLLRIIVADYTADAGSVFLFGQDVFALNDEKLDKLRMRFGMLLQAGALFSSMTAGENVALPLREHTDLDESIIEIIVNIKLDLVDLKGTQDLMPSELSGGMRKRVALSRAIALDPEILFYDEPTAGLDPIIASRICKLIRDLSRLLGVTSLVVTHDMASAAKIADRIIIIDEAQVVFDGEPKEVVSSEDERVRRFVYGNAKDQAFLESAGLAPGRDPQQKGVK